MYRYTPMDARFVRERVAEFRDQVRRRLAGELSEDEFRPLRLMNGLYLQRHAYMLRIAIPYGQLSSAQMRKLGYIAQRYDRGFGHFTTRQNIQFHWMALEEVPDVLMHLAEVEMNAIQTSGNCVRNITSDPFSGVAPDELVDVRPYCEILRQYFALHPEFMYLPRKFKFALTGAREDRAATCMHDVGIKAVLRDGQLGFEVSAGGGLGRTPRLGQVVRDFVPPEDLVSVSEAILRVYNLYGRRDNKFKARIKILVGELGIERFRAEVDREHAAIAHDKLDLARVAELQRYFEYDGYVADPDDGSAARRRAVDPDFDRWMTHNVQAHRVPGYHAVVLSLKPPGRPPGDLITEQFYAVADLMDRFNGGRCVTTYEQNLVLQDVRGADLSELYDALRALRLASPNIGTIQDLISCPGLDYCSLANSSSIPVAQEITERFADLDHAYELGFIHLKMSGCINACGHHHMGHIGILGIDKRGEEFYQLSLGGSAGGPGEGHPAIAEIIGPAVARDQVVDSVERLLDCYVEQRQGTESFIQTVRRVGLTPFKAAVYAEREAARAA